MNWKVILLSNGFANVDVKCEMNAVNDHSWESYAPADHRDIIINEVDFPVDYLIFSQHGLITFLSHVWPLDMNAQAQT